ncbi:8-oxo-dGTP diphosphatase [Actinoplanes sp. N902-109]|uniref:NUDIX hydrolase n=1 Tax=Actinoplanes sp. (strain N902-109) TaxID=649831 RepID=UPI00032953A7|nr:8-oxo-dGTP diphosphatase [Actinoplanes sp. N902-109]AGL21013.1 7,8-dihydro-8-oxoguanine-triphosphatase [Actinoplanes sp. N902-109]
MQAILATLGYVLSPDGREVLMIRRDARPDDIHYGYYNGLGGKLEPDEDVVSGLRREIREEAALDCTEVELAGTISWPGFGRNGENWFGFLFRIPRWSGTPLTANDEGSLHWMPVADVLAGKLPMWESDRHFLPLVFAEHPKVFHGVMPFTKGRATSWSYRNQSRTSPVGVEGAKTD